MQWLASFVSKLLLQFNSIQAACWPSCLLAAPIRQQLRQSN